MKPRYKRRIFWTSVSAIAGLALAIVIVPPLVNLNTLKPKIENAIIERTGVNARINGNINFSLMGGATIVAHNVNLSSGNINSVMFSVPLSSIFNLKSAPLDDQIFIYGAKIRIDELTPPNLKNEISLRDTTIRFMEKDYEIVTGVLSNGLLRGTVRTEQYKYDFDSNGDTFHIRNRTNNLEISGNLYSDGSAHGHLSIDTNDINKFFEFDSPNIRDRVKLSMRFDWDGKYGFKFHEIKGRTSTGTFHGNIELFNDGTRDISLFGQDINMDLSFLLTGENFFTQTKFDGTVTGNLKLGNRRFKKIEADVNGKGTEIVITKINADDNIISGGKVTGYGAQELLIKTNIDSTDVTCLFSGTPINWKCSDFTYGNLKGSLSVNNDVFEVFILSDKKMPSKQDFAKKTAILGNKGTVNFQFADIGGTVEINNKKTTPFYRFAKNKSLAWLNLDLKFLPDQMQNAVGDFVWDGGDVTFIPHSNRWKLALNKNSFYITGKNAKEWLPALDLQSLNDLEYIASGNYKNGSVANLEIKIAGHLFKGSAAGKAITLSTELLNIDSFINQDYVDNYDELQFLTAEPLLIPFGISTNISLSADTVIYNGNDFTNFVYSLRDNTQTFSITDSLRGSLLASIKKEQNKYNLLLQLNRFAIADKLLTSAMPINISGTTITGQAVLSTFGQIAYDIWYNLAGDIDISFDGGVIHGFGIDKFYANSQNITKLNAEYLLADALDGGTTQLKSMHIVGEYDGGNFVTSQPFTLSMKHTDVTGILQTSDNRMSAKMNLVLRGTSPLPAPIIMEINPSGKRNYSLSEIMINFDPDYFRDFVATHDKF